MEILSTSLIDSNAGSLGVAVIASLLSMFFIVWSALALRYAEKPSACFFSVIAIMLGFLAYSGFTADRTLYTTHEVRITDMSKFDTEKYEIIEQRGKIFVVKEITKGDR